MGRSTTALALLVAVALAAPAFAQEPATMPGEEPSPTTQPTEVQEPEPPEAPKPTIDVLLSPPQCYGVGGNTNISLLNPLVEHFDRANGQFDITSTGWTAMSNGPSFLFAERAYVDPDIVRSAADAMPEMELVAKGLPLLVSPYELMFVRPGAEFDWLSIVEKEMEHGGDFPDTHRSTGSLYRATVGDQTIYRLDIDEDIPVDGAWLRQGFATGTIAAPDDEVQIVSLGRTIARGARVAPVLAELRRASPKALVLHAGDVVSPSDTAEDRELCGKLMSATKPSALVPRGELVLGPNGLPEFAKRHALPYLAANLRNPQGKHVLPRFELFRIDGLTIAVIGVVDPDQLAPLAASVSKQWTVDEPAIAVRRALDDLEAQLQRPADLVVVLAATRGGDGYDRLLGVGGVDLLLGHFSEADIDEKITTTDVASSRVTARYTKAAHVSVGDIFAVGRLTVEFDGSPPHLRRVVERQLPVLDEGPLDLAIVEAFREIDAAQASRDAAVLLPDIAPIIARNPALHPLVWGPNIPQHGAYYEVERSEIPRYSDPLWMRLVTNLLREGMGADLAISRNLPRNSNTVGPISRSFVSQWLGKDSVRLVRLRGRDLREIARALARQSGETPAADLLFTANFDPRAGRVGGRAIEDRDPYLVAVTDYVVELPALAAVFGGKKVADKFERDDETFAPAGDGEPLLVRDVIMRRLDAWAGAETAGFDEARVRDVEDALKDHAGTRKGRWRLDVAELAAKGALYRNTQGIDAFAVTRETRLTTPNNFAIGGKLATSLLYDDPFIAWETGVNADYARVEINVPGADIPPQESADDLVPYTELRFNAIAVAIGDDGRFPLVPFLRAAYDTEFTATLDPADPTSTLPFQRIARTTLGIVATPGAWVPQLRVGAVGQLDVSEPDARWDAGVAAGLKLAIPLWKARLESTTDVQYLVPDSDDTASDLALRLISSTKLVVPIWQGFAAFAFFDAWYAIGKTSANDEFGGSAITGGGLQFSEVFIF